MQFFFSLINLHFRLFCQIILALQMLKREQMQLDYKLAPLYSEKLDQLAVDSKVSFDNFQTPGWSSIMHTETSPDHNAHKHHLNQQQILQKLNRLAQNHEKTSGKSRIRLPNAANSNIIIYEQQKHLIKTPQSHSSNSPPRSSLHSQQRQSAPTEPTPTRQQVKNTEASRVKKQKKQEKEQTGEGNNQSRQQTKRFGQITVHEHLYLQGIKQSKKRMMQQILDEQYKKQNIMSFRPQINPKSQQLAEVRLSRIQKETEIQQELSDIYKKSQITASRSQKASRVEEKQQNRHRVLNRIFCFLSKGESVITKQTIKDVVQQLPLMCIKALQKVLQKVYSGSTYTWLEFLSEINSRKVVSNKQGLINIFQKWQSRLQKQPAQVKPC